MSKKNNLDSFQLQSFHFRFGSTDTSISTRGCCRRQNRFRCYHNTFSTQTSNRFSLLNIKLYWF